MEEKRFIKLLLYVFAVFLIFSVLLFASDYCQSKSATNAINSIRDTINSALSLKGAENLTEFERYQYNESIFMKLIDWGEQGTVSWGVTFLAAISVFFMVLLELHPKEGDMHYRTPKRSDIVLSYLAFFFLAISLLSVSEVLYYYRYVAILQNQLLPIYVPRNPSFFGLEYFLLVNFGGLESIIVVTALLAFLFFYLRVYRRAN